jgi:hypothetical protein
VTGWYDDDWEWDACWEDGEDAATWSPDPEPFPEQEHWPRRKPVVTVYVPAGADRDRMYGAHVVAALLEDRCPHCYATLLGHPGDERVREGWRLCPAHGWWRRHSSRDGLGWEWRLGFNPHTMEPDW